MWKPLSFIADLLRVLSRLWFALAVIFIAGTLLIAVDQARDIFYGLSFDRDTGMAYTYSLISFTFWGIFAWFGTRLLGRTFFEGTAPNSQSPNTRYIKNVVELKMIT